MTRPSTVLLLAGEASGDHHGAGVARALRAALPGARLTGLGGPAMAAEGVELLAGLDQLAVMGFVEVVRHLAFFRSLERRIQALLDSGEVDLVLPIDYPGLNLRIAREAHARGLPVLYYISPQVWAWRAGRASRLAEYSDAVAVILPFEARMLEEAGARATFVGHPLLERPDDVPDRASFCARWQLDAARPLLALLPGSRRQEIERHLDLFLAAAARVREAHPDVQPVVARASSVPYARLARNDIRVVEDTRALLRHARAGLVKSGTSTLEAALEGMPFVMAYRTHPLSYEIARRVVRVDHVALANLVAGERVVTELLQGEATPARLASEVLPLLDEGSDARARQIEGFGRIRGALGTPGASARVAEMAVRLLEARR